MFIVRCIPVVGTAVVAVEAVDALVEGDGNTFLAKTAQATISGGLDALFIASGGASSLVTAPMKGGMVEGAKIAGEKSLEHLLLNEAGQITIQVAARAVTEIVCHNHGSTNSELPTGEGSGSSNRTTSSNSKGLFIII